METTSREESSIFTMGVGKNTINVRETIYHSHCGLLCLFLCMTNLYGMTLSQLSYEENDNILWRANALGLCVL